MPNLLAFALPHFPSCFCNGFPLGIGQLLSRIINQNLASPSPPLSGRVVEKGRYGVIYDARQTDREAAEQMPLLLFLGRKRTQCARSSFAHFFKAAGKSIWETVRGRRSYSATFIRTRRDRRTASRKRPLSPDRRTDMM